MTVERFKTRDQLVEMAADLLFVTEAGGNFQDEDRATIDGTFDGLIMELAARGICEVANDEEIPIEWCDALSQLLANQVAPVFGQPKPAQQESDAAEDRLRIMVQRVAAPNRYLQSDRALTWRRPYNYTRWRDGY